MKWNDDAFTVRRYIGIGGLVASAVVLALITRLTVAYLGDTTETAKNNLNVGYADVSIVETFNEPSELIMSNTIAKEVRVQNKGTVPAFVRVYAEFSDSELAAKAKVKLNNIEYTWSGFKEALNYSTINSEFAKTTKWRYVPTDNTENGTKLGGYFYYTDSLTAYKPAVGETAEVEGQTTEALFDSVTIDYRSTKDDGNGNQVPNEDDSNIDRIVPLEMIIYSELVQVIDTGRSAVTTKTVDDNGNLVPATEEGGTVGNPVESSRYGYNFSDDVYGNKEEWEDAWKRFLYKTNRTPTETVNPNNNEPEP